MPGSPLSAVTQRPLSSAITFALIPFSFKNLLTAFAFIKLFSSKLVPFSSISSKKPISLRESIS